MPDFLIENTSPLIKYEPAESWLEGDKVHDLEAFRYSGNSSFTVTRSMDATATFNFTGTSLLIGGARRANHGPYSVTLDGSISNFDGHNPKEPGDFRFPLFKIDNLGPGEHTVTIRNLPVGEHDFLDVDFIQWSSPGVDEDPSQVRVVEDTAFQFDPPSAWSEDIAGLLGFSNNNGHMTFQSGATSTVSFQGTGISLYGPVGPNMAPYSVALDNASPTSFSASKSVYYPAQMLYHVDGLASGDHVLRFTCGSDGQQTCAVDSATIYSADSNPISTHTRLSKGAIAGIIIGLLVFLALLLTTLILLVRRRRHVKRTKEWRAGYAERAAQHPPLAPFAVFPSTPMSTAPLRSPNALPPVYQAPSSHSRIAAWARQTREATLETTKSNSPPLPPMIQVTGQTGDGQYAFSSPRDAIVSPKELHPSPSPFHLNTSAAPSRHTSIQSSNPQPSPSVSPSFWPIRITRSKDPVGAQPDPSFGRDMGDGRKFVDLVG